MSNEKPCRWTKSAFFQPSGDNVNVEHIIVAHEATEAIQNRSANEDGGFGKYPCVKEKLIKEVASEILRLWMFSVGNIFYARDAKTLKEGLDMFFVEEKKRAGTHTIHCVHFCLRLYLYLCWKDVCGCFIFNCRI